MGSFCHYCYQQGLGLHYTLKSYPRKTDAECQARKHRQRRFATRLHRCSEGILGFRIPRVLLSRGLNKQNRGSGLHSAITLTDRFLRSQGLYSSQGLFQGLCPWGFQVASGEWIARALNKLGFVAEGPQCLGRMVFLPVLLPGSGAS